MMRLWTWWLIVWLIDECVCVFEWMCHDDDDLMRWMEGMSEMELNDDGGVFCWMFELSKGKRENPLKLSEEMKMGKDLSFVQITSMREGTMECCHQQSSWVIVMFDFRASANAFLPESPILFPMECDTIKSINNHQSIDSIPQVQWSERWIDLQCFW